MMTETIRRVPDHTDAAVNERIHREIEGRIAYYARNKHEIDHRLAELDAEWDIERTLQAGSAILTVSGIVLSKLSRPRWLLLSAAVQGFFLQHVFQGWCPPLPILRRLGVRTAHEIEQERYALKALRGDFAGASNAETVREAVNA